MKGKGKEGRREGERKKGEKRKKERKGKKKKVEDKDTREVKDMTICEKMQIFPPHRHQESILAKLMHHSYVVAQPCTLLPRPRFLRRRSDSSFECVHPEKVDGEGVATCQQ